GAHGRFVTALSGGSTPRALFELLATERFASSVDWGRIHVCWGDERAVPPDAEASNYRMAREALLDHVQIPASQVHRIRGEEPPLTAAAAYERTLRTLFATPVGPPRPVPGPRFDLVLLGSRSYGHTVFLFDVDNTLLDNDRVAADLKRYLTKEVGDGRQEQYWEIFEELRRELGYADYLGALQRYRVKHPHEPHLLAVSSYLVNYPFAN